MRVLHVINDLRVAGAERLVADLAPRLAASGLQVEITLLSRSPAESHLERELADEGSVPVTYAAPEAGMRSPRQVRALKERMRGFDLVHVHLFPSQLWVSASVALLPSSVRPVLVTTEHNTYNSRRTSWFRPIDTAMYQRFDRIIAISEATAEALRAWVPNCSRHIQVITNGVDLDRVARAEPAQREAVLGAGVPASVPLALCVGRMEPQKDHATLLEALKQVPDLHLALVGDGALRPELEAQAERLGVKDRTHFLGRRDDVPSLLKMAGMYVQPSRWEGFGIAAVEAMAAGLPVIFTDVPGLREVIGEEAGLRTPVGDATSLAQRIRILMNDPSLTQRCGAAGRERAKTFGMEPFVEGHLKLYTELVEGRR